MQRGSALGCWPLVPAGATALKDVASWLVLANGTILMALSVFCFCAAVWRPSHAGVASRLSSVKAMPQSALIIANSALSLIALGALGMLGLAPMQG